MVQNSTIHVTKAMAEANPEPPSRINQRYLVNSGPSEVPITRNSKAYTKEKHTFERMKQTKKPKIA